MGLLKQKQQLAFYDCDDMQKLDKPEKTDTFEDSSRLPLGMNFTTDKDVRVTTPPPLPPTPEGKKTTQSTAASTGIAQKEANQFTVDSEEPTELHQTSVHLEIKFLEVPLTAYNTI
ncbi:uncharacterized protein ACN427_002613 [Glossina fuscipes fuscipes]